MPQKKSSEQTPIAPKESGWGKVMRDAKPTQQLYPKLFFGGENKEARGIVDVLLLEDEPASVLYEDPYNDGEEGEAFRFNVQVLASSFSENPENATRALFIPGKEEHGLTRQIAEFARQRENKMRGLALRIEVAPYKNKKYRTTTRGYTVTEIPAPNATDAP